jgi:hypothetical protein
MLAAAGWGRMYGVWAKLNPGAIGSDQTIQVVFIRNIFGISLQLHSIIFIPSWKHFLVEKNGETIITS